MRKKDKRGCRPQRKPLPATDEPGDSSRCQDQGADAERDSCFTDDAQKINIYEKFKQLLDWADDEAFKNIKVI